MIQLTTRERRHQRTQQAILDAALEIIHEKGVEALSMRAIADKIDYSAAGLYEYYGSKEEIIAALCIQGFQRFSSYLGSVDKSLPAEEYMSELGLAYIDFALQNSDFFLLMFTTAPMLLPNFANSPVPDPLEHLKEDDAFTILVRGIEPAPGASVAKIGSRRCTAAASPPIIRQ